MTVVYSKTYSEYSGLYFRTKCDYTVTSSATSVTVSGTIQLQYYGTYKSSSYVSLGAMGKISSDNVSFSTDTVSPDASKSTWTNVGNSKSFTFSNPKNESAYVKTYYVSCGYIIIGAEHYNTFSVSVPALTSYNVTYNANGGSGAPATQKKYYGKTLTLSSVKPTKTGYSFWHWNTTASNSGTTYNSGASYTSNAGATLYAIWNPIIYYNGNGVSLSGFSNQVKTYGNSTNVYSSTPVRDGYRFVEWNTSADGTGTKYMPSGSISSGMNTTMTLYAIWQTMPANPKITSMSAIRCDENGVEKDEGGYCYVTVDWEIDATSEAYPSNSGTVTGTIREEGGTEQSYSFDSGYTGTSGTAVGIIGNGNLDTDLQYVVKATITDQLTSTTKNVILTRAFYIMDFKAGGVGLGIGRAAPNNGLQIGYETTFDEDVSMVKDLSVDGDETVNGTVTVGGDIEADGAATVDGNLTVGGAEILTGNLTVGGAAYINGGNVDARLDWDGSTTGVDKYRSFVVYSKANPRHQIGQITVSRRTGNYTETYISVRNPKLADPASHVNSLGVRVYDDGGLTYSITSPAAFRSALAISDYVTSTGSGTESNATWTWRKWASGKIEAWCSYAPSSAVATTVWVSPIRYKDLTISIPSGVFSSTPGRVYGTSFNNQMWVVHAIGASATSITCRIATLSSNNITPYVRFYCTN